MKNRLTPPRGLTVTLVCFCGATYTPRVADIERGWGKSCSKRCAAIKRKCGHPNARYPDGSAVGWGKKYRRPKPPVDRRQQVNFYYADDFDPSWDAHKY